MIVFFLIRESRSQSRISRNQELFPIIKIDTENIWNMEISVNFYFDSRQFLVCLFFVLNCVVHVFFLSRKNNLQCDRHVVDKCEWAPIRSWINMELSEKKKKSNSTFSVASLFPFFLSTRYNVLFRPGWHFAGWSIYQHVKHRRKVKHNLKVIIKYIIVMWDSHTHTCTVHTPKKWNS